MRAYQFHKSGKPEVLKIVELSDPTPGENEVKVKIVCIGINYAEILSRKGQYRWAPKRPYVPGMEAYGVVVEIGKNVSRFAVGEKVIVGQQYGGYAEFACVAEHLCFPAIASFSPEENAAYLVNFMTAWVALKKLCRVESEERVLIHAAAGGVGTAAVQIAKALGCHVFGTASKMEKLNLIKKLGADMAINYTTQDFYEEIVKEGGKVDCVLEVVGGDVFKKSLELLNPFGRMAVIGFASINLKKWNPVSWWQTWKAAPKVQLIEMSKRSQGIYASHIGYLTDNTKVIAEIWDELEIFVQEHQLRPIVGKTFDFEDLPSAHRYMESRESVGKIVVNISH
ncbi:MAG: NADPH:quinone oxidoreductase family protein [Cyclobacteriaceae bacterium]